MKKKLNITVLVDIAEISPEDPEFLAASDQPSTEYHVIETLRNLGHNVSVLGSMDNIEETIIKLKEQHPDLVFNLTEHLGGDRKFDKNIAALLEMLEMPLGVVDLARVKNFRKEIDGRNLVPRRFDPLVGTQGLVVFLADDDVVIAVPQEIRGDR